jgi:tetratricopeptide (TPR) repeat protein
LLAKLLLTSGSHEEGLAQLREALPLAPRVHYNLGVELLNDGKIDEGLAHLQTVVALSMSPRAGRPASELPAADEVISAHHLLAAVLFARQAFGDAVVHYQAYLSAHPDDIDAINHLGVALIGTGNLDEAIAAFRRALQIDPKNAAAERNLANALQDRAEQTRHVRPN